MFWSFVFWKNTFFSKVLKNWSSCQKTDYPFLGGGSEPKVMKITFFNPSLMQKCIFRYAVQEQEHAHGRGQDFDEGGGFMEYTQP